MHTNPLTDTARTAAARSGLRHERNSTGADISECLATLLMTGIDEMLLLRPALAGRA
jgi:hypothetical protein